MAAEDGEAQAVVAGADESVGMAETSSNGGSGETLPIAVAAASASDAGRVSDKKMMSEFNQST